MAAQLRWLRIAATVRLRQAGPVPWLVFVAWVTFCWAQEPAALRTFGIRQREPAIWAGASVLWLVCGVTQQAGVAHHGAGSRILFRFAVNTVLLCLVVAVAATAQAIVALVAGDVSRPSALTAAGWMVLALLPVSLAMAGRPTRGAKQSEQIAYQILKVSCLGPAASICLAPWLALDSVTLFAATGLSTCASLLLMIATSGEPGLRLPPRKQT